MNSYIISLGSGLCILPASAGAHIIVMKTHTMVRTFLGLFFSSFYFICLLVAGQRGCSKHMFHILPSALYSLHLKIANLLFV